MKRTAIAIAVGALCAGISGGVLAQEQQQQEQEQKFVDADQNGDGYLSQEEAQEISELDQEAFSQADSDGDDRLSLDEFLSAMEQKGGQQQQSQQQQEGQQQEGQQQGAEGAQVTVDEKPADVDVQAEAPDVTVEQEKPDVTVEQPEPQVEVTQPEPEVNVEQAEPDVSVQQQGEPEVEVKDTGEAEVEVTRPEDQEQQDQQQQQSEQSSGADSLMSMQVGELEGTQVVNNSGQEIGEIGHVARHTQDGKLYGIVTVGGFWGIGGEDIALPLDEMQLQEDQLVMQTDRGEDEIKQSAQEYREEDYSQLESGQTLQEAASSSGG